MTKKVNKKRGFAALELLLVIGLIAGIVAGVFQLYKSIKASTAQDAFNKDLMQVISAIEKYNQITELDPAGGVIGVAWKADGYIKPSIAKKWKIINRGAKNYVEIQVVTSPKKYPNVPLAIQRDSFLQKCDAGSGGASGGCRLLTDK